MTFGQSAWRPIRRRFAVMATTVFLVVTTFATLQAGDVPQPTGFEQILARIVAQLIETQHYAMNRLDDEVSSQLFDEFFNSLDPKRRFFLSSDIDDFSLFRYQLDDHLKEGRVDFPYVVYKRFLQRVRERIDSAEQRLTEPFDFTLDESILLDRSKEPWPRTTEELDEIWRKHLKNRVLIHKLIEEAAARRDRELQDQEDGTSGEQAGIDRDAAADPEPQTDGGQIPEATEPVPPSPEERILEAQIRHLRLLEEYDSLEILELYLGSLARVYDPHSTYMAPATEEDFDINMSLSLQGIGAVLTTEDGYVSIVEIIPGGPADRDGRLAAGDRITAVAQGSEDAVDVVNMPLRRVVRMIRGPKGSTVTLTVIKAGQSLSSMPHTIDIVRDEVKLAEREARSERRAINVPTPSAGRQGAPEQLEQRDIMVIALPSFYSDFGGKRDGKEDYKSSSRDVRNLLHDQSAGDIAGLILDLRGNGGGSLEEAIKLAGLFFKEGPVVQVRSSGNRTEVYRDTTSETVWDGPLVIMVDRLSASASEIVAACIQDYNRAVIVGENATHGKGTVQTVLDLNRFFARHPVYKDRETGALKFTMAKFYRINGGSTQKRGVTPHIRLPSFHDAMDLGEDRLTHALPWDQIDALDAQSDIDITPYLAILKQRSESRLERDAAFQEHLALIQDFAALQERTTLTLHKDQRAELQRKEDELMKRIRAEASQRRNRFRRMQDNGEGLDVEDGDEDDDSRAPDFMLDEAMRIMGDLIWLSEEKSLLADTAAQPDKRPPGTGKKSGAETAATDRAK